MSIDYDYLRELLQTCEDMPEDDLKHVAAFIDLRILAPDMAVDLLRLREGIEIISKRCAAIAESAQAAGIRTFAHEMDVTARALSGLLQGENE